MKKNDRRKRKLQEEACDYEIERTPTTRYEPDYEEGLTSAQAEEHRRDGWSNVSVDPPAQTTDNLEANLVCHLWNNRVHLSGSGDSSDDCRIVP